MRQATVAVFEDTDDRMIVINIRAVISARSFVPDFFTTAIPIHWASPVWNIAAPMTNMPAKSTTVEFDSPAKTSFGVRTPRRPSATAAPIAVTASGMISVAKKIAATASTPSVSVAASIEYISYHISSSSSRCIFRKLSFDRILNSLSFLVFLLVLEKNCNEIFL
jgi:hypothetical protein